MEKKIIGLNTEKLNLKDKLLFAITSSEDAQKCAKIIQNSKLKRIKHFDLPDGYEVATDKKVYVYCIDDLTSKEMINIVGNFIEKYEYQNLSDVFEIIEIFTKKLSSELTIDKLEGDIGEALFIKKCIELGYKEQVLECCNQKSNQEARIDFEILDNKFEIKTTSNEKQEINITDKQILEKPNVVVVSADFNKEDITILNIYDEIKKEFNNQLPLWLEYKYKEYSKEGVKELINNRTLNKNGKINFFFFDESKLPVIHENLDYSTIIKKITYTLNLQTNINTNKEFDDKLINIINKLV